MTERRFRLYLKYAILILTAYHFISCSKTVYVPVETTRVEYRDRIVTDSVHIQDSVIVKVVNDTIFIEKYNYQYKYINKVDSFILRDTVQVAYPVEHIVYKNDKKYWKYIFYSILAITVIFVVIRFNINI